MTPTCDGRREDFLLDKGRGECETVFVCTMYIHVSDGRDKANEATWFQEVDGLGQAGDVAMHDGFAGQGMAWAWRGREERMGRRSADSRIW